MGTPKAKYVITADDETSAAWRSALSTAKHGTSEISTLLKSAAGFGALTIGVEQFGEAIHGVIERGDQFERLSKRLDASTESLSQLEYAAKQLDIPFEAVTAAIDTFQKGLTLAQRGAGRAKDAFKNLHLDVQQLINLPFDDKMDAIAEALSKVENSTKRAGLEMQIFGSSGAELDAVFRDGAVGLKRFRDESDAIGNTLNSSTAKALAETDEAIKKLKASVMGFLTESIGGYALLAERLGLLGSDETLTSLREQLMDLSAERQKFIEGNKTLIGKFSHWVMDVPLAQTLDPLDKRITEIGQKILELERKAIDAAKPKAVEELKIPTAHFINPIVMKELEESFAFLELKENAAHQQAQETFKLMHDNVAEADKAALKLPESVVAVVENVDEVANKSVEALHLVSSEAENAAQSLGAAFEDFFFDPVGKGLKGLLSDFISIVRRMVAQAASAKLMEALFPSTSSSSSTGTAASVFQSILSSIFKADGGPVSSGKGYIVGERGPEFFRPNNSGTIIPNNQLGGGMSAAPILNITTNIDARGATTDLVQALPAILKRNNDALETKIVTGIKRRQYKLA